MLGSDSPLSALLVGGVDLADMPDPDAARTAVQSAGFVVSLEIRHSSVTELADVVFPVSPVAEKPGTFLNWEGRERPFETALRTTGVMPDQRVLQAIAAEMGIDLGLPDADAARAEIRALGTWSGKRVPAPHSPAPVRPEPQPGQAVLASWHLLLDRGRLQDGDPNLAGTAHPPVVRLCADTAEEIGASDGQPVSVSSDRGTITLPLVIADLPPRVVWLPLNSTGSEVNRTLGVSPGDTVTISNQVPQ
jgi:NADH-quinone oxidoreductase subunit G